MQYYLSNYGSTTSRHDVPITQLHVNLTFIYEQQVTNKIQVCNSLKISQYFIVEQYNSIDDFILSISIATHLSVVPEI